MKYVVSGNVYFQLVVEANSPEEANSIAHNTPLGDAEWERVDWWIAEPEDIDPLQE